MSNIFQSSFTPGKKPDGSKFPSEKVYSTFNSTFASLGLRKRFADTFRCPRECTFNKNNNLYKRQGKPIKPNTGSMDRLNRIKAAVM